MLTHLHKLSSLFLFASISHLLKTDLSRAKGWDAIESALNKYNYSIGESFAKNKYYLKRDNKNLDNMYLRGNHEYIQLIEKKPCVRKKKIPRDAAWSWAAKYEKYEDENDADLTGFFAQNPVSQDIQQFLQNISDQDLGSYIPLIRKNPQITLQELKSIQPAEKKKVKEPEYTEAEVWQVARLQEPYKTWVLIQFRKLRLWAEKHNNWDNYAWFKRKFIDELQDWFQAEQPQIASYTWKTAIEASDAWHKAMSEQGGETYIEGNKNIVYGPKWKNPEWDGWTIKQIKGENDLKVEGNLMDNCVGGYSEQVKNGDMNVYSLRDPQNKPHATPGEEPAGSHHFIQLLGVGNSELKPEYKKMLGEWFKTLENVKLENSNLGSIYVADEISHQNYSGLYNMISDILDGENDYGMPVKIEQGELANLFYDIVGAVKRKTEFELEYSNSNLENTIEIIIVKAKDSPKDMTEIEEYIQDYYEKLWDDFNNWQDANWEGVKYYTQQVKEELDRNNYKSDESYEDAVSEEVNTKMEQDYMEESKKYLPHALYDVASRILRENKES